MPPSSLTMLKEGRAITNSDQERDFRAHFGGPSLAIETLWSWIVNSGHLAKNMTCFDLLMTLSFVKNPGENLQVTASRFKIDEQTMLKKVAVSLLVIDATLPEVRLIFFLLNTIFSQTSLFKKVQSPGSL